MITYLYVLSKFRPHVQIDIIVIGLILAIGAAAWLARSLVKGRFRAWAGVVFIALAAISFGAIWLYAPSPAEARMRPLKVRGFDEISRTSDNYNGNTTAARWYLANATNEEFFAHIEGPKIAWVADFHSSDTTDLRQFANGELTANCGVSAFVLEKDGTLPAEAHLNSVEVVAIRDGSSRLFRLAVTCES